MHTAVTITKIRSATGFDPHTLLPTQNQLITFTVGTHGPFTITVPGDKFNPTAVQQLVQAHVDTLVGLGVIPAE